jgi:hypothetical protein
MIICASINLDVTCLTLVPLSTSDDRVSKTRSSYQLMTQNLAPEVRQIIERILQLEKDRLDRKKNSPINDDILKIIKEVIV